MAISRFKTSSVAQGLPKYQSIKDTTSFPSIPTASLQNRYEAFNSASYSGSGTTWTDVVSSSNLTLSGTTFSSNNGGYLTFSNGQALNTGNSTIAATSGMTVSVWMYPTSGSGTGYSSMLPIFSYGDSGGVPGSVVVGIGQGSSYNMIYDGFNQTGNGTGATGFDINTWQLFTFAFNSSGGSWYKNGTLMGSLNTMGSNKGPGLSLGKSQMLNTNYFAGRISAAYVYTKALSSTEVTQLFNANKWRYGL